MAHEHEYLSVKAAQEARETLACERLRNNNQALVMDDEMEKALSDTQKVIQEVVVQKAIITKITSDRVANIKARKLSEAQRKRLERICIDYEDRMQEQVVRQAELTATHQSL